MLKFSRHARNRMRRDRISADDVLLCIEQPEETTPSIKGRTNYTRRYRERTLRVTAKRENGDYAVVTVTLK